MANPKINIEKMPIGNTLLKIKVLNFFEKLKSSRAELKSLLYSFRVFKEI